MDYPSDAAVNLYNGKFYDGNPAGGIPASLDRAAEMNAVYDELKNLITTAGLTPDEANLTQVTGAVQALVNASRVLPGAEMFWPTNTVPNGWFEEDGSLLSMTTYQDLYDVIGSNYGLDAGVATTFDNITNTATANAHGRSNDEVIELSNSGGALPTGLTAKTKYFIVNATANTFQVAATKGGAVVAFTTDGTGTNSHHWQYALPDAQGEHIRVWDHGAGIDPDAATRTDRGDGTTGDNVGTKQRDEFKSHNHTTNASILGGGGGGTLAGGTATATIYNTGGNETRGRNTYRMFIIKY